MKKQLLASLVIVLFATGIAHGQDIRISEIDFATSVENHQPAGVDTVFSPQVGKVFCFTHVEDAAEDTKITHIWYYKDEEKARVTLDVRSNDYRTWSSKSIWKTWTGRWRVMVEDEQGNVLVTKSFVIKDNEAG